MKNTEEEKKTSDKNYVPASEKDSYTLFKTEEKKLKKKSRRNLIIGIAASFIVGALAGSGFFVWYSAGEEERSIATQFKSNWLYKDNYSEAELNTMVRTLKNGTALTEYYDQFTSYAPTKEKLGLQSSYSGVFGYAFEPYSVRDESGTAYGGELVTRVHDGSYRKAGGEKGDVIIAFKKHEDPDYTYVQDIPSSLFSSLSKGNSSSTVTDLLVVKGENGKQVTYSLATGNARVIPVTKISEDREKKELTLKIWTFVTEGNATVSNWVSSYISDFLKENGTISHLVLDLRDNGGGYTEDAYNTACLFLDKGQTVYATGDNDLRISSRYVQGRDPAFNEDKVQDISLVLNGNSASATELFSNALIENGRATAYGQRSYGKGVQQVVIPIKGAFAREYGVLKVTNARIITPQGNCVEDEYDTKGNVSKHNGILPLTGTDDSYKSYLSNLVSSPETTEPSSYTSVSGENISYAETSLNDYGRYLVSSMMKKIDETKYGTVNPLSETLFRLSLKEYQREKDIPETGLYDSRTMYMMYGDLVRLYDQGDLKELTDTMLHAEGK